jgi:hypothetical protein
MRGEEGALVLRGRTAITIETTVGSACTAGKRNLSAQCFACAMNPDGGVVGRDARLFAQIGQTAFLQINPHQSLAILGLQSIQESGNALAYVAPKRGFRLDVPVKLADQSLRPSISGSALPIIIDDGVSQNAIEPGDGGLFVANRRAFLKTLDEGRLQNVFRSFPGTDTVLNEFQELETAFEEAIQRLGRERS